MILRHVTVDCAEPYELATFWSKVTGWPVSDQDQAGDPEVLLHAPSPVPSILFIRVPEGKFHEPRTTCNVLTCVNYSRSTTAPVTR